MREGNFAGAGARSAADESGQRSGMMGVAERPLARQSAAAQPSCHGMNYAELERFGRFERRQYPRQARRQHRFACTGRADHQEIVVPRRGNFERALGAFLPFDVNEIESRRARRHETGLRRRQKLGPLKMVDDGQQARCGNDLDLAGPSRLPAASAGTNDPVAACRGGERRENTPLTFANDPSSASSPNAM